MIFVYLFIRFPFFSTPYLIYYECKPQISWEYFDVVVIVVFYVGLVFVGVGDVVVVALLDITDHIALLLDTSIEFVWVGWFAKSFSGQTQR